MKALSARAMKRIAAHDFEVYRQHRDTANKGYGRYMFQNRTRFYKYLVRAGSDIEIRTVAVKERKGGEVVVKEIIRASVDNRRVECLDVVFYAIAGYSVNWNREGLGAKKDWDFHGRWSGDNYMRKSPLWKIRCEVVNPEALKRSRRFKWCAWSPESGDILDYLKIYAEHPRVEFLSKCGCGRFATLAGFVKQLEGDKGLMKFFSQHLDEIKEYNYGVDVIRAAYGDKITMIEASRRIHVRRRFHGYGLPACVDADRAAQYIDSGKAPDIYDYCKYLNHCVRVGLDLADTKTTFPRQFKKRAKIVSDAAAAIERARVADLAKRMNEDIAKLADKLSPLEKIRGLFSVKIPRCEEDMQKEGKVLDICVGKYADRVQRRESVIAFIRESARPDVPFFTLEYLPAHKVVSQCYGLHHAKPPKKVLDFVNGRFLAAANKLKIKAG